TTWNPLASRNAAGTRQSRRVGARSAKVSTARTFRLVRSRAMVWRRTRPIPCPSNFGTTARVASSTASRLTGRAAWNPTWSSTCAGAYSEYPHTPPPPAPPPGRARPPGPPRGPRDLPVHRDHMPGRPPLQHDRRQPGLLLHPGVLRPSGPGPGAQLPEDTVAARLRHQVEGLGPQRDQLAAQPQD